MCTNAMVPKWRSGDNFWELACSFLCVAHGPNSGQQNWWQTPLLSEPSPWPGLLFLIWQWSFCLVLLYLLFLLLFLVPLIISLGNKLILSKYCEYVRPLHLVPHWGVEASRHLPFERGSGPLAFRDLEHWHETLRNLSQRKLFSQCRNSENTCVFCARCV